MPAILTDRRSTLLPVLLDQLETIAARLADAEPWVGQALTDPESGFAYQRLASRDRLVNPRTGAEYFVALHRFDTQTGASAMHDHRFPLAVYAFGEDTPRGEPLYDMPWESRRWGRLVSRGTMVVGHGEAYAIERCAAVRHAVEPRRPHCSVALVDLARPPRREDRLEVTLLVQEQTQQLRSRLRAGLARAIG